MKILTKLYCCYVTDIVDRVKRPKLDSEEIFRPNTSIIETETEDYVITLMRECWSEDPNLRPDFTTIRTRLKKMKGK